MKRIQFMGLVIAGCILNAGNLPALSSAGNEPGKGAPAFEEQLAQAGVSEGGWRKIQEVLRADSFTIGASLAAGDEARGAFNAAHGLDIRFPAAGGMRLGAAARPASGDPRERRAAAARGGSGSEWWLGLKPAAIRSAGGIRLIESEPEAAVRGSRLEQEYAEGLTEWFVNSEEGVEQGFVVEEVRRQKSGASEAEDKLTVDLEITGNVQVFLDRAAQRVVARAGAKGDVLIYHKLAAWDAAGQPLSAWFELASHPTPDQSRIEHRTPEILRICVDARGAQYPVTIDPLAGSPNWTAAGEADNDSFGYSVGAAGDVNGDGYGDVIVGAYGAPGGTQCGKAYVFLGSASGVQSTTNWTAAGEANNDRFGCSVGAAGDVNGDGFDDVIVGAYNALNTGMAGYGKAYVFLGSAAGVQSATNWSAAGEALGVLFGNSVGAAGDVNGDGYGDVIVGAYGSDIGGNNRGKAYVFLGSAAGVQSATNWSAVGEADDDSFGYSVGAAGDVNGDGYGDVIAGANAAGGMSRGKAYVFLGSAAGVQSATNWIGMGEAANDSFGSSVGAAGDVNGDGFGDVIVGAYYAAVGGTPRGKAYVFLGSAAGVQSAPNWTAVGEADYDCFGYSAGSAGDVNGDGFGDVIVGAYRVIGGTDRGQAYVFLGSAAGVQSATNWTVMGEADFDEFGYSVGSAGDVNGDGFSDVIVGARGAAGGSNRGQAYVFNGSAAGVQSATNWSAAGEELGGRFGNSVGAAGDVNGDGYGDVIVGANNAAVGGTPRGKAYVFLGSAAGVQSATNWSAVGEANSDSFGSSVGAAGDVNGDGYGDVIVGANGAAGGMSRGKAYVFLGSAAGVQSATNWIGVGEADSDSFGSSVGAAGDVNGDGFSDVIVGAHYAAVGGTSPGKAYVFLGSAAGVQSATNWTAVGDANNYYFGYSVGAAGDVNGDGFGDVIVGALHAEGGGTDRGQAYVFLGSAAGVQSATNWTVMGEADSDSFGYSVGAAGDVNGDGFSDVIVGAPGAAGGSNRGQAYVFNGSAAGVQSSTNWSAAGEGDGEYFGYSVGAAGDVNGDGYGDVIVGAYLANGEAIMWCGKAYVFLGSASGVQSTTNWTASGVLDGDFFGCSVGSAGDVNGDGYGDVIVGAYGAEGGGLGDRGQAYVFLGSAAGVQSAANWTATGEADANSFGISVGAAGDVNGDGYGDVIIGASLAASGGTQCGKAYVFLGSAAGVQSATNWTAAGEATGAQFGNSVGAAGDVNGDGYGDVIVGAFVAVSGGAQCGKAYVFLGSASGVQSAANWSAAGEANGDMFGRSVGAAGDVNSDGYGDVIVGARGAAGGGTQRGKAYVFLGSAAGVQSAANWISAGEANGDLFGCSVGAAGDVNGDGYGDVIVGAYSADAGGTDRGQAYVFLGSAAGVQSATNWIGGGGATGDLFGISVGAAGDVNGDGYGDVIVGARGAAGGSNRGQAYVFLGNDTTGRVISLRQQYISGGTNIARGGMSDSADSFKVAMNATHPAGRGRVKLEVQAIAAGKAFGAAGTVTNITAAWVDSGTNSAGAQITNRVSGLGSGVLYNWRTRVLYEDFGATNSGVTNSAWPAHGPWRTLDGRGMGGQVLTLKAPGLVVLGTNLAAIASGEAVSRPKGTDYGAVLWDGLLTNVFTITNSGSEALEISGITLSGAGALAFSLTPLAATIPIGGTLSLPIGFEPPAVGVYTAAVTIANNSTNASYVVYLAGAGLKQEQAALVFTPASPLAYHTTNALSVSGGSGAGAVSYAASGPGQIVELTNLLITSGTGMVQVCVTKAGDALYNSIAATAQVAAAKASQTITDFPNPGAQLTTNTVQLRAQASSGLSVTNFRVGSGPGVISGLTNLTFTNSGSVSVTADQAGNPDWNSAPAVTNTFEVRKVGQTITFLDIPDQIATSVVRLAATADSGLPVIFTNVIGSPVSWQNATTIMFTATGTVGIVASQTGNSFYAVASAVTNTFNVLPAPSPAENGWLAIQVTPASGTWQLTVPSDYAGPTAGTGNLAAVSAVTGAYGIAWGPLAGYTAPSNQTRFVTSGSTTLLAGVYAAALAAPAWVSASAGAYTDKVQVIWESVANATSYGVWRNTTNKSNGASQLGTTPQTNYADITAEIGRFYYYWVKAANAYGASAFSGVATGWLGIVRSLAADFDGDGRADPAVYLNENWYIWMSMLGYAQAGPFRFGYATGIPVPADYDGDTLADPAVVLGTDWLVWMSNAGYGEAGPYPFGQAAWAPVAADFDGDRQADPARYGAADSQWYVWMSSQGYGTTGPFTFGTAGSLPLAADFDGDGLADPAAYDPIGNWHIWMSGSGYGYAGPFLFGASGWAPVAGDYDHDGKADPAVTANGTWYVWMSSQGYALTGPYQFVP